MSSPAIDRSEKRWTEEEIVYLEENIGRRSAQSIGKVLGRTAHAVRVKSSSLRLSSRIPDDGITVRDLADHYKCPYSRIYKLIHKGKIPRKRAPSGAFYIWPDDITPAVEKELTAPYQTWKSESSKAYPKTKNRRTQIGRERHSIPQQAEEKPWGSTLTFTLPDNKYTGKVFWMKAGHRMSLQYHTEKEETVCLIEGKAMLIIGGNRFEMRHGTGYFIPRGLIHRLEAVTNCMIIEASTPEKGATVRMQDDYGRHNEELG